MVGTASASGQTRTTALNVRFPKKFCAAGRTERPRGCSDAVVVLWVLPWGFAPKWCFWGVWDVCHGLCPFGGFVAPWRWQRGAGTAWSGQGCGAAWGHGVPHQVPVAAHSSRVSCSRHGWGRGTVLRTRGQRVPGPRAQGAGCCLWHQAGEVAGGTWLSGASHGTGTLSPAPSSRSQPKIPAETKVSHPGEAGAGVPHLPGFCSITARAPRTPPAASPPPLPPGAAGVPLSSSGCLSGSHWV